MTAAYVLAVVGLVVLLVIVLELVRKRYLRERFAIAWILAISALVLIAVIPGLLDNLSALVGIQYPPTLLLVLAVVLLAILVLGIATQLSSIDEKLREVAEYIALRDAEDHRAPAPDHEAPDTNSTT
jgi:hypothetical protein